MPVRDPIRICRIGGKKDCTGVVTFNTPPGAPPLVVYFVVAKHGTEILGVVDGAAITLTAHKVD